jgi:pyridoxal phosphate enzyme (YggS family)
MSIADNLALLKQQIPHHIKLVAVTKTMLPESVREAYDAGHRIFGENKVQELVKKQLVLPEDIEWHLIGHLQTNKVKYIVHFVKLIHTVDSLNLLSVINKEAGKVSRKIDCLLQIHIAKEETKFGMSYEEVKQLLNSDEYKSFHYVRIIGLMGMATFTNDSDQIRREFSLLAEYFYEIKMNWFFDEASFKELSMGMSGDYKIAIDCGSTIVRIGSLIFGLRDNLK